MYLKAIELENFKSFVHKNRIEFKQGFTAISGPNGSGKSNIGDAILFVLGPKSSKVIRANKLTDLIYDGGKKGRPADYCRVSLIFDNSDRVLPIDSNEVKLTRYVKRANNEQGYNSYFYINDEPARLQDFVSLLEHAKISADGYNFVKQGDVTRIVEMTPVERRQILDEISGIAEFDKSIAKAEEKKRSVEENIEKINVLLEELKSRLKTLEEDRKIALRYKEIEEKLKETRAKIAYSKMIRAREEIDAYSRQIESLEKEISDLKRSVEEKKKIFEELNSKKIEIDEEIGKVGGPELKEMQEKVDSLKIEIAKIKRDIEHREDEIQRREREIKTLKDAIKNARGEMREREKKLKDLKNKLNEKEKLLREKERKLEEKERSIKEANERFKKLSSEVANLSTEIDKKRKEYQSKVTVFNTLGEKINVLRREIARLEEDKRSIEQAITDAEWRIKEIKANSKNKEKEKKKLNERYMALNNRRNELKKKLSSIDKELSELRAQYERLRGKMEGGDALSVAVNAVLEARNRGILRGIYGTIAELASVDEKYELAIQVAAGNRLMSIVCEDDEAAARAIEFLKKNHLGRAIFLPLNKMLTGRPRGRAVLASRHEKSYGYAIDLLKFDKKFEPAFWYVFGDTVVVEDLDTARKLMGGVRLVTLDGQLIEASGAMVGGSVEKRKSIGLGNLKELDEKIRSLLEEREAIIAELNGLEREIEGILREISNIGSVDTRDIETWMNEKHRLEEKLAGILREIKNKKEELENQIKLKESIESEINALGSEIDRMERHLDSLRLEMENALPEKISNEIRTLRKEVSSLSSEVSALREQVVRIETEVKSFERDIDRMEMEIEEHRKAIEDAANNNEKARSRLQELIEEKEKYSEIIRKHEEKIKELVERRDSLSNEIDRINQEIGNIKRDIEIKEQLKINLLARARESGDRYEEYRREYESYGIKVEKPESIQKLKKYEDELSIELRSLGDVNLKSIEEYDIESERYEKLKDDYDSLVKEKKEIEKLVSELNEKKKYALKNVFRAIDENFRRIYREMSNGGEAHLYLENEEDPFKGGLIIKVKPPGKGLKRLDALSGGEKSLTALAFIFAIQQYDPSPIYLLDEVDMFLDGVNSEILGRIIKRNSRSAQFIVVSLRKATIKFADHIIGVTNRGDGISRIYMHPVPEEVPEGVSENDQ